MINCDGGVVRFLTYGRAQSRTTTETDGREITGALYELNMDKIKMKRLFWNVMLI